VLDIGIATGVEEFVGAKELDEEGVGEVAGEDELMLAAPVDV
jgi:hypothetical protein